jgi:hypothetical protein
MRRGFAMLVVCEQMWAYSREGAQRIATKLRFAEWRCLCGDEGRYETGACPWHGAQRCWECGYSDETHAPDDFGVDEATCPLVESRTHTSLMFYELVAIGTLDTPPWWTDFLRHPLTIARLQALPPQVNIDATTRPAQPAF